MMLLFFLSGPSSIQKKRPSSISALIFAGYLFNIIPSYRFVFTFVSVVLSHYSGYFMALKVLVVWGNVFDSWKE